jgi:hypothetical protein
MFYAESPQNGDSQPDNDAMTTDGDAASSDSDVDDEDLPNLAARRVIAVVLPLYSGGDLVNISPSYCPSKRQSATFRTGELLRRDKRHFRVDRKTNHEAIDRGIGNDSSSWICTSRYQRLIWRHSV